MYLIKEMPKEERPRERLISHGPEALSMDELIAILLRTGDKEMSVVDLSKKVLYHLESLDDLKRMTVFELMNVKGIKEAKATTLVAAIELGRRLSVSTKEKRQTITSAFDVYHDLYPSLSHLMQEHFIAIYLNVKSEIITKETIQQEMHHPPKRI